MLGSGLVAAAGGLSAAGSNFRVSQPFETIIAND